MGSLRSIALRLKTGTEGLNYGREIVGAWGAEAVRASRVGPDVLSIAPIRVLDLGCGDGTDLRNVAAQLGPDDASPRLLELHGLENWKPNVEICHRNGIATHVADIERDELPFADGSFDLVIANQILEHTKEIFWIAAEVARVLRPGGRWIVGVPNLASLHNRLLLVCGQQPTAQQSASAHVRGFTRGDFTHFAEQGDFFRTCAVKGSNFYPLPPSMSRPLSRTFPSLAWGLFVLLERTAREGSFLECLHGEENFLETPFVGGPQRRPSVGSRQDALLRTAAGVN